MQSYQMESAKKETNRHVIHSSTGHGEYGDPFGWSLNLEATVIKFPLTESIRLVSRRRNTLDKEVPASFL